MNVIPQKICPTESCECDLTKKKNVLADTINIRTWRWDHLDEVGVVLNLMMCQEKRKRPHKGENDMKMEEEIERIHL